MKRSRLFMCEVYTPCQMIPVLGLNWTMEIHIVIIVVGENIFLLTTSCDRRSVRKGIFDKKARTSCGG